MVAALLLAVVSCASDRQPKVVQLSRVTAKAPEIRVATYNVFTGTKDGPKTAEVIRRVNADVVMLQEIAPKGAVMLDQALKRDYRHRYFSNGLAILSRFPIRNPRFERSQVGINGFLFAEFDHPAGRIQVADLHLDPLRLWTKKDRWMLPMQILWKQGSVHRIELEQIKTHLRPDLPTVIAGDFNSVSNVAPKRLREMGFIDSFAAVTQRPDATPTLHFTMFGRPAGRRIDYIFHDQSFQTLESKVLSGGPSDHDLVVSVLRFNSQTRHAKRGQVPH